MNDLLSRVLQRATHPGGGLEPLRASRVALRAGAVASMTFPAEEVHEKVASADVSTTTVTPIPNGSGVPVRGPSIRGEVGANAALDAAPQLRTEQALKDEALDDDLRHATTVRQSADTVKAMASEPSAFVADSSQAEFLSGHSERESFKPLTTRALISAVEAPREMDKEEITHPPESAMLPALEISIGHIDVQAAIRAPERPRTPAFRPRVSLHDFLARSGRR
ncbi:hypothetical protein [Terriglobus roseus]|uniref:Uncharacterized protein n=1 Tax=Terriglobus roseus TaxID=392734 RepID=A0A1G7J9D3_9BACT|nr:hypothetical protein [Terriglobus roseus]SDF21540.1 hypothetical protein SAMN05444167_1736 [Terriglobus roseus]